MAGDLKEAIAFLEWKTNAVEVAITTGHPRCQLERDNLASLQAALRILRAARDGQGCDCAGLAGELQNAITDIRILGNRLHGSTMQERAREIEALVSAVRDDMLRTHHPKPPEPTILEAVTGGRPTPGQALRYLRCALDIGHREAAVTLGLTDVELSELERGKRDFHDWPLLYRMLLADTAPRLPEPTTLDELREAVPDGVTVRHAKLESTDGDEWHKLCLAGGACTFEVERTELYDAISIAWHVAQKMGVRALTGKGS